MRAQDKMRQRVHFFLTRMDECKDERERSKVRWPAAALARTSIANAALPPQLMAQVTQTLAQASQGDAALATLLLRYGCSADHPAAAQLARSSTATQRSACTRSSARTGHRTA